MSEEQKNATLKEQNAILATSSTRLGREIEKLEKIVSRLEKEKDKLTADLKELDHNIKSRESERQLELNLKGEELIIKEESLDAREKTLESDNKFLSEDRGSFNESVKSLHKQEEDVVSLKAELSKELREITLVKGRIERAESDLSINSQRLKAKITELDNKIIEAEELALGAKNSIASHDKQKEEIAEMKEQSQDKLKAITEDMSNLSAEKEEVAKLKATLENKIAEAEARDKDYEGKLEANNNEYKKIKIAWLKVNKKIEDARVDIQLEELQK